MQQKKDLDSAISDFTRIIELNPQYAIAYKNRGVAHLNKRDNQRAIADFKKALELGLEPSDAQQVKATLLQLR